MYVDVAANAALGKSRGSKKKETAGLLRVMIREYREMQEYVQAGHRLPKGLNRITHAELLQTFEQWGVATKDSGERQDLKARDQMIHDIKLMAGMQPTSSTLETGTRMDISEEAASASTNLGVAGLAMISMP